MSAVVPLFNTVIMEINSACNRRCVICPNHKHHSTREPNVNLSLDLIEKVVEELKDIKFDGRLEPLIFNEPLMHPKFMDIMQYIYSELPKTTISLNTNADYIKTVDDLREIVKTVHATQLNLYSPKRREQLNSFVDQIKAEGEYEFVEDHVSKSRSKNHRCLYVMDKVNYQNLTGIHKINNRGGQIDWLMPTVPIPLKKMCVRPFRQMVINYKGDLVLCCNEYFNKITFGNIRDHTLVELWGNSKLNKFRRNLLRKNRNIPKCRTCDFNGGYYQHMVNKYWEIYLQEN
jgi:radical SAM protein with 4Fe4S-binding SPASM domain